VARFFGRRVEQLALPMRPLDSAQGMDSTITVITGPDGRPCEAAWLRTLRSTGDYVYSGCYSTRHRQAPNGLAVVVAAALALWRNKANRSPRFGLLSAGC
jgi:hypothetical protein